MERKRALAPVTRYKCSILQRYPAASPFDSRMWKAEFPAPIHWIARCQAGQPASFSLETSPPVSGRQQGPAAFCYVNVSSPWWRKWVSECQGCCRLRAVNYYQSHRPVSSRRGQCLPSSHTESVCHSTLCRLVETRNSPGR